jgi:hypothetical protein
MGVGSCNETFVECGVGVQLGFAQDVALYTLAFSAVATPRDIICSDQELCSWSAIIASCLVNQSTSTSGRLSYYQEILVHGSRIVFSL